MSTLETNLIQPSTGTTLTVGASGDTISMASGTTNRLLTPVVRVYGSADQTGLSHNAYNTIAFNTEQLDTAGAFATGTYKFTTQEAGYYLINLQFSVMTTGGTLITILAGVYNETQSTNAVGNFRTVQKPIICGNPIRIFSDLQNNWKEWPLMRGQEGIVDEDNKRVVIPTYFFVNPKTKTYTVIQTPPNVTTVVCIIASGVLKDITEKTLEILLEEVKNQKGQAS